MQDLIKIFKTLKNNLTVKKSFNELDKLYNEQYYSEMNKNIDTIISEITEGKINRDNMSVKAIEYKSTIDELIEKRRKIESFNDKNSTIERAKITSYIDLLAQSIEIFNDEIGKQLQNQYSQN